VPFGIKCLGWRENSTTQVGKSFNRHGRKLASGARESEFIRTCCGAIASGSRHRILREASFSEVHGPDLSPVASTPGGFGTSFFLPSCIPIGVSQYIPFKKKVVKSSEIFMVHRRTSTSTCPEPPHEAHFLWDVDFPEPLQLGQVCFSRTVTRRTILSPGVDIAFHNIIG